MKCPCTKEAGACEEQVLLITPMITQVFRHFKVISKSVMGSFYANLSDYDSRQETDMAVAD